MHKAIALAIKRSISTICLYCSFFTYIAICISLAGPQAITQLKIRTQEGVIREQNARTCARWLPICPVIEWSWLLPAASLSLSPSSVPWLPVPALWRQRQSIMGAPTSSYVQLWTSRPGKRKRRGKHFFPFFFLYTAWPCRTITALCQLLSSFFSLHLGGSIVKCRTCWFPVSGDLRGDNSVSGVIKSTGCNWKKISHMWQWPFFKYQLLVHSQCKWKCISSLEGRCKVKCNMGKG